LTELLGGLAEWVRRGLADFPEIFDEFRGKRFWLLWQSGRDGFGAHNFQVRCDGHANTLTVILDIRGNIFDGFLPVGFETAKAAFVPKGLCNYLFTLKNAQGVPARKFWLRDTVNKYPTCDHDCGPIFRSISICDKCDEASDSYTGYFGEDSTNDTGFPGATFFGRKSLFPGEGNRSF
jgi:hypothetical protein